MTLLVSCLYGSIFVGGGCHPRPPGPNVIGYEGRTDPINKVVADVNQNADQIPTLRGGGDFEAWITEHASDKDKTHYVNGQVTLLYQRPQSMRLIGNKDIAGRIFEIGSNDERYWVIIRGEQDTMWTGTWKNIGRIDPSQLPVRPDLVIEVLGVQSITTNLL